MRKKAGIFFGRHRVRATFYHLGFALYLAVSILDYNGLMDATFIKYFLNTLIVIDYIAEMYDPNPALPGPLFGKNPFLWLKAHFHRIWDRKDDD